jgi:Spy/CpxP family protein refolding chaperone
MPNTKCLISKKTTMKTTIENAKWIILTLVFVMIASGIFAQKGSDTQKVIKSDQAQVTPAPPPPPPPPPPPAEQGMESMRDTPPPAFSLPDLTNDQMEKIKKMDLKQMELMTPLRNQMREKKVHLMTLLSTPPANIKEADNVTDEIGKLEASILKQQIRHDQELRNILTPDQQIVFDARPKPFLQRNRADMKGPKLRRQE